MNTQISLSCPHEENYLGSYSYSLSAQRRLVRLGGCPGWSESSLGARSFCWFCHASAQMVSMNTCGREVQIAALQTEINYVLLYLIMLFWNIWHVKIFLKWPNIYVKYGLDWQWLVLHNTFTVFEWANLWGVKIITENVYCKVQNDYKIIFY